MLRVNLATRPFYNERGVHLALAALAVVLAAVTVYDVRAFLTLSAREAEVRERVQQTEAEAARARAEAARLRATLAQEELETVLAAAREANRLIDRRTFSWTALLNHLEETLPADVMLTAVRPSLDEGAVVVTLAVVGRTVGAIGEFMDRLEATGAFAGVLSRDERMREDGGFEATLVARYRPREETTREAAVASAARATR